VLTLEKFEQLSVDEIAEWAVTILDLPEDTVVPFDKET
jgi:hypothetical protein